MDRRTFLGVLATGLLAAPLAAEAEQAGRPHRIASLANSAERTSVDAAFLDAQRDLGSPMSWSVISNNTLTQVALASSPAGNTGRRSIMEAWSGGCFDTKRRRLVISGGGHSDYAGNEVCAFDVVSGLWSILKQPSTQAPPGVAVYPDGTPSSRHTYGGVVYDPVADAMVIAGGSVWDPNARTFPDVWRFNFATNTWTRLADSPDPSTPLLWYDTRTSRLWTCGQINGDFAWHDGLVGGRWTKAGNTGNGPTYWASPTGSYSAAMRKVYASGSGWGFSIPVQIDLNVSPPRMSPWPVNIPGLTGRSGPGLVCHPTLPIAYVWLGGNQIHQVNLTTNAVTNLPTTGVAVPAATGQGVYGRFVFDPGGPQLLVVNAIDQQVYGYALVRTSTLSPPPPPTPPAAFLELGSPRRIGHASTSRPVASWASTSA